jgi:hypothetical protein
MAIEGIEMGAGGTARLGDLGGTSGPSVASVCVDTDATSGFNTGKMVISEAGTATVGVAGGLKGCSGVWGKTGIITPGVWFVLTCSE